jgi:hypothetical protein
VAETNSIRGRQPTVLVPETIEAGNHLFWLQKPTVSEAGSQLFEWQKLMVSEAGNQLFWWQKLMVSEAGRQEPTVQWVGTSDTNQLYCGVGTSGIK